MSTSRCPYCAEEIQSEAVRCRYCHEWLVQRSELPNYGVKRRLSRSRVDRQVSGVCGGIASYFDLDPTLVRIVFVLGMCFSAIIPGIIAYIIMTFVIPIEGHATA